MDGDGRGATLTTLGPDSIPLRIRRNRRAKRLILRADPSTGEAVVTCPTWVSDPEARAFAEKQAAWVRARLASAPPLIVFADGVEIAAAAKTMKGLDDDLKEPTKKLELADAIVALARALKSLV